MRPRLFRRLLAIACTVACTIVAGCAARPGDLRHIVISYEESLPSCGNCPHYRIEFSGSGAVRFYGAAALRVCAATGDIELFRALLEARHLDLHSGEGAQIVRTIHQRDLDAPALLTETLRTRSPIVPLALTAGRR